MPSSAQAHSEERLEKAVHRSPSGRPIDFSRLARRIEAIRARRASEAAEINLALAGLARATPLMTTPANDDAPSAPVREVVTKSASATRRKKPRSGLRQREDARDMRVAGRSGLKKVVKHLPSPLPTSTSPSTSTFTSTTPTNDNDASSSTTKTKPGRGRLIASWKDAGDLPRAIAINRGLDRFGVPFAFSLNLDPKLIQAGNDNARGLLDYMRRRVALKFKRTLGETPPMWIAIETDEDDRPHLHGGLALNDRHAPTVVLSALAKAGGNWTRPGSAPADLRLQHDPDGWAVYPFKRKERTRRVLRELAGKPAGARVSLYAASAELLAEGKSIHDETRRAIGRR